MLVRLDLEGLVGMQCKNPRSDRSTRIDGGPGWIRISSDETWLWMILILSFAAKFAAGVVWNMTDLRGPWWRNGC